MASCEKSLRRSKELIKSQTWTSLSLKRTRYNSIMLCMSLILFLFLIMIIECVQRQFSTNFVLRQKTEICEKKLISENLSSKLSGLLHVYIFSKFEDSSHFQGNIDDFIYSFEFKHNHVLWAFWIFQKIEFMFLELF